MSIEPFDFFPYLLKTNYNREGGGWGGGGGGKEDDNSQIHSFPSLCLLLYWICFSHLKFYLASSHDGKD